MGRAIRDGAIFRHLHFRPNGSTHAEVEYFEAGMRRRREQKGMSYSSRCGRLGIRAQGSDPGSSLQFQCYEKAPGKTV